MARRNLLDDATRHHFVGDFSSCPVADRAFFGLLAGQCDDLAGLFGGDMGRFSGTWDILQALPHREFLQRHRLQANPAHAPTANRIHTDFQISGDLAIILAFCRSQDHAPPQSHLLGCTMPTHQCFQFLLFLFAQRQCFRFGATHALSPPLFCWPYFTPELFQLQVILNDVAKSIAHSEEANYLTMLYTRTVYWGGKRRAIREVAHTVLMITYYVIRDKKMHRDGADYSDKRNAVYSGQYNNRRSKGLRYTVPLAHPVQATRETRALFSAVETRSNVWRLFCIWAWIGLTSFGGGASSIFLIQREFIEKRNWVSSKEFSHFWNLCGVTPGTSQIALSILIGQKLAGTPGLIASMVGLVLPSAVVTYLLAAGFQRIESIPIMQAIWRGIIPATSGLMFLVALRLAQPLI